MLVLFPPIYVANTKILYGYDSIASLSILLASLTNVLRSFVQNTGQKQPPEVFYKKPILKNFAIFTGKYLCWILYSNTSVLLWILRNFQKYLF